MNLLIVDDDIGMRTLLVIMMRRYNYTIFAADDGQEGLAVLSRHPVDLIITDLMMPGMNGYAFIEAIRQNYDRDDLPILVLSAVTSTPEMRLALAAGANRALSKPVTAARLKTIIMDLLNPAG